MKTKASIYNTFFDYESNRFGYNSYTNEFILIDPVLYEMVEASVRLDDFSELKSIHVDFYDFLVAQGFLVDKTINEFDRVKEHARKIDDDSTHFHLIVNPTMNCNFKCWYCYETHIKDSRMSESTMSALLLFCKNVISEQSGLRVFTLSFFGGEPLLYFDKVVTVLLAEVSTMCKANDVSFNCHMTTNGLLLNEKVIKYCSEHGLNALQITLDGNRDQHNKVRFITSDKGSYDKIVENIKLAIRHMLSVNVRINCSAETMFNIDDILRSFEDLSVEEKKYIQFNFQRVWQETSDIENQLSEARRRFARSGYNSNYDVTSGVLNSCYADKRHQATVNFDGEVFKCTARDFKKYSGEGSLTDLGQIVWNSKYEERMNAKFKNEPCKTCRILPICGGGCSQAAIEALGNDYCVMGYDENAKTRLIVDRFRATIE